MFASVCCGLIVGFAYSCFPSLLIYCVLGGWCLLHMSLLLYLVFLVVAGLGCLVFSVSGYVGFWCLLLRWLFRSLDYGF